MSLLSLRITCKLLYCSLTKNEKRQRPQKKLCLNKICDAKKSVGILYIKKQVLVPV